jgi:molybdate-binding protein
MASTAWNRKSADWYQHKATEVVNIAIDLTNPSADLALGLAARCATAWKLSPLNREKFMMLVYATFKNTMKAGYLKGKCQHFGGPEDLHRY